MFRHKYLNGTLISIILEKFYLVNYYLLKSLNNRTF